MDVNSSRVSLNLLIEERFKNTCDSTISHHYKWKVLPSQYPASNLGFSCEHPFISKNHSDYSMESDFTSIEENRLVIEPGRTIIRVKGRKSGEVSDAFLKLTYEVHGRIYLDEKNQSFFVISATSSKNITTNVHYVLSIPRPNILKRFFYKTDFWIYEGQNSRRLSGSDKNSDSIKLEIKRTLDPQSALDPLLVAIKSSRRIGTNLILKVIPWCMTAILLPLFIAMISTAEGRSTLWLMMKAIWSHIRK